MRVFLIEPLGQRLLAQANHLVEVLEHLDVQLGPGGADQVVLTIRGGLGGRGSPCDCEDQQEEGSR